MIKQSKKSTLSNITKISSSIVLAVSIIAVSAFNFHKSPAKVIEKELKSFVKNTPDLLPIQKEQIKKISSGYGLRIHPINKMEKMHNGVDFIAPKGTPILATADGVVVSSELADKYGNRIQLKHDDTYETHYAHLSSLNVKAGEKVKAGQTIGIIGNTGESMGIHLHYEVLENGEYVNPVEFFDYE